MTADDLAGLPEEARRAFRKMDRDAPCGYAVAEEWQTVRAELLRLARKDAILTAKNRGTLANNLCPDHRDKQTGKSCLACTIETLTHQKDRAESESVEFQRAMRRANESCREIAQMLRRAESERDAALFANRDRVDHFDALKADYDALRKRIDESETVVMGYSKGRPDRILAYAPLAEPMIGKRAALLPLDDAETKG